jgi:hypothetical protein
MPPAAQIRMGETTMRIEGTKFRTVLNKSVIPPLPLSRSVLHAPFHHHPDASAKGYEHHYKANDD